MKPWGRERILNTVAHIERCRVCTREGVTVLKVWHAYRKGLS